MFGFLSPFTSNKVMVAKISVDLNGSENMYTWAKAYCIECALESPNWSGSVNVKEIFYSSSGDSIYVAVQVDADAMVLHIKETTGQLIDVKTYSGQQVSGISVDTTTGVLILSANDVTDSSSKIITSNGYILNIPNSFTGKS
jgi:hypothetical protein